MQCLVCIAAMGGDLELMHSRRPNSAARTLPGGCCCSSGQEKGSLLCSSGTPTTLPPSLWLTSGVWSQPLRTIRTISDRRAGNDACGFSLCWSVNIDLNVIRYRQLHQGSELLSLMQCFAKNIYRCHPYASIAENGKRSRFETHQNLCLQ